MEGTLEEKVFMEVKVPDDDQGGIRQRLRDRDLLRKRRAEAEEKMTNQAKGRKRARREPTDNSRKKGRPKKKMGQELVEYSDNQNTAKETPIPEEETGADSVSTPPNKEIVSAPTNEVLIPALAPIKEVIAPFSVTTMDVPAKSAPTKEVAASAPSPAPAPSFSPAPCLSLSSPTLLAAPIPITVTTHIPIPATMSNFPQISAVLPASTILPSSYVSPEIKAIGEVSQGVIIEDFKSDKEDKLLPQGGLIIDQGGVEEAAASIPETIKELSDSVLVLP